LELDPRHEFLQGDICDPDVTGEILRKGVDAVVNFAAESHVDRSILHSYEFVRTNLFDPKRSSRAGRQDDQFSRSTDGIRPGNSGAFSGSAPLPTALRHQQASADLLVRLLSHTGFPGIITRCQTIGPINLKN
jgi:dTDP-glucose 4,6-dehydratase